MKKIIPLVLFSFILLLYATTTSPYLQAGDSAEMAAVLIARGVPHQPSYPMYVFLGNIFTNFPITYFPSGINIPGLPHYYIGTNISNSTLIYRSGLFSSLLQAIAVVLFYSLIVKISLMIYQYDTESVPRSFYLAAAFAALFYGLLTTVWLYATKPEVFALNNVLILIILNQCFTYWSTPSIKKFPKKTLFWIGLAFVHHQTSILIAPLYVVIYLFKQQQLSDKNPLQALGELSRQPFDKKFNRAFPYMFFFLVGIVPYFILLTILSRQHNFINWGEISNPIQTLPALFRVDYGTIGAYLSNTKNGTVVIDQLPFFIQHIAREVPIYLLVISLIGYLVAFRQQKRLHTVLLLGLLFSGPMFLMYANFALDSDFSKATVARFYLLPSIFIASTWGIGSMWINQKIVDAKKAAVDSMALIKMGHLTYFIALSGIAIKMILSNMPHYDDLTYTYAKSITSTVEDDALIMETGDIPNMTLQYMQAVEDERKKRIIFSPGQFHLKWFQKQLRERYPNLRIPHPLPGKQFTTVTQVVDANWGTQPIYVSPEFIDIDPELSKKYVLWPKNLLLKVEKRGTAYKLEDYLEENNQLFSSINIKDIANLRSKKYQLESPLITFYARHFFNLGAVLNGIHRYDDALIQYQRSITIDPSFAENYKAIANILYATPDYSSPDPVTASQMYTKYLQTVQQITPEEFNSIKKILKMIEDNEKKLEENKRSEEERKMLQREQEATSSATESSNIK